MDYLQKGVLAFKRMIFQFWLVERSRTAAHVP